MHLFVLETMEQDLQNTDENIPTLPAHIEDETLPAHMEDETLPCHMEDETLPTPVEDETLQAPMVDDTLPTTVEHETLSALVEDEPLPAPMEDDTLPTAVEEESIHLDEDTCIICGSHFSDDPTKETSKITAIGLNTLISSSKQRKDGNEDTFRRIILPRRLHKDCRAKYTLQKNIISYLKRKQNEASSAAAAAKTPRLRSSEQSSFNPLRDCIFCTKIISLQPRHKDEISRVSTLPFITALKEQIKERSKQFYGCDKWGSEVEVRISAISDLVADDGQYHRNCFQYFYMNRLLPPSDTTTAGRPKGTCDETKMKAFSKLCDYIE